MIKAHGETYATKAEAEARIAELNELNLQLGASDGRVTEIQCILEALQEAGLEAAPVRHASRIEAPKLGAHMVAEINKARRELALIKSSGYDDGQWRYLKFQDEAGRVTRREYRTQKGFLKAFIKAASEGKDILIAE